MMENVNGDMDVDDNNSLAQQFNKKFAAPQQTNSRVTVSRSGPPEIDPVEIEKNRVLGDGSFGTVYAGKCRQKDVAVKFLLKQDYDEKTLQTFRNEVEVMSKIFHPNINLFMGACTVPGQLMIVTELMKGDLESLLVDEQVQLSLLRRLKIAKDAALGILWLHSSNPQIIHRDLKASNLLIDDNLTCKICDFGLSQIKPRGKNLIDGKEGAKGTPLWMAPEVMMGEQFNEKADVYSFSLILWFLLETKEPYEQFEDLETFARAVCIQHVRPAIPQGTDPGLKDLITRCWAPNPADRPTFSEIVQKLDHIMIDVAIEDPLGRQFWRENFFTKDPVPWNDFLNAFSKLLRLLPQNANMPLSYVLSHAREIIKDTTVEIDIKCLKAILADEQGNNDESIVSLEKFGNILRWFGPLNNTILQRIRVLMTEPWFHGDIITSESETRLLGKPEGTFLVRFSTSTPGCYTISKVSLHDATIKHQKIQRLANYNLEINGHVYKTLQELVRSESIPLNLHIACAGSRFPPIFMQQKISGYVN